MRIFGRRKVLPVAVFLMIVGMSALLITQIGLRILVTTCDVLAGPAFSVKRVEGTFFHGWRLAGVAVRMNNFADISMDTLSCNWSIKGIRYPAFYLSRVRVTGVQVRLHKKGTCGADKGLPALPEIHFPLEFHVDDLQIVQADIFFPDKKKPLVVNRCVLQAVGRGDRLSIGHLKIDSPKYGAALKGALSFHDNWPLNIDGRLEIFSLKSNDWQGTFAAQGDLESLRISIDTTQPIVADAQGRLSGILHDLRWTVTGKTGLFRGSSAGLNIPVSGTITGFTASGSKTSYSGGLSADIRYPGSPDMQTRLRVHGDYSGLDIDSLHVLLPGGNLGADGRVTWENGIAWQAELRGEHVDPAVFFPQWPGNIQAVLSTRGSWNGTEMEAAADIERLQGTLRGRPLIGSGKMRLHKDVLLINALHLRSGSTSCRVNGRIGPQLKCTFRIDSSDPADIVPGASGVLHGQGTLKGEWAQPRIEAIIRGIDLNIQGSSLRRLQAAGNMDFTVNGTVELSVQGKNGMTGRQITLDVSIPSMYVRKKNDDKDGEKEWHLTGTSLQAELKNGTAEIRAQSEVQGIGRAEAALNVQQCESFAHPEKMPLAGTMDVNLSTLDFLAPLSGYLVNAPSGHLSGHYSVAGTLARPVLQGDMTLSGGAVEIPDAGILLHDIQVGIVGTGTENKVDARLVSGPGRLRMQGILGHDPNRGWYGKWNIKGEDVQALHLAEYSIWASPDLHCVYGREGLSVNGAVTIPKAYIAPVRFRGVVSPSRDVLVVDAKGSKKKDSLPLSSTVTVTMGKEVELDAFGIKGFLDGSVQIIRKPGEDAIAIGSLQLRDATFTLRGSILKIENGLVFYQGGPLADPNIDLRADKNVQGKVVGIRLTGRASRMKVDLFSDPAMNESDILAYLLVGHNFSQSDGVERALLGTAVSAMSMGIKDSVLNTLEKKTGLDVHLDKGGETAGYSLVVSKKIYKNLFLSYGKGLTDSESILKIQYQLPEGFSVETESTSTTNKVELFWSVEH